mgnify:CR=1 FL=1
MLDILYATLKNVDYTVPIFCIKAMAFITGFFLVATIIANLFTPLYNLIFSKKYL